MFIDSIGVMEAAGCYPLPPSTGQYFVYPGPRTHDGILHDDADPEEAKKTFGTSLILRRVNPISHDDFDELRFCCRF